MGLERWAVLPADRIGDEDRFFLEFAEVSSARIQPFMQTIGPMTETELRLELTRLEVSEAEAEAAVASAKAEVQRGPNP